MVMKLIKALYGTKQAGRAWNQRFNAKLIELGFERATDIDDCFYQKRVGEEFIRLNMHVDDCCATYTDKALFDRLMEDLREEGWDMSDAHDKNRFLGMEYERLPNGAVALHQSGYIQEIIAEFPGMDKCKAQEVPHDSGKRHSKVDCPVTDLEKEDMANVPYRRAIGMLRYLADGTRPEICASLGVLSQFQANPGREHWKAIKRIVRYLKGTPKHGLIWGRETQGVPYTACCTFADSSWADWKDDRTSRSGYVTYSWGGPVGWKSRKERAQALSSSEAEYVAACEAAKEVIWCRRVFAFLGYSEKELSIYNYGDLTEAEYKGASPSIIFDDSTACIGMSRNPINRDRNKHIDLKYHFVRHKVAQGEIKLVYVPTEENVADIMTKTLAKIKFKRFRDRLVNDVRGEPPCAEAKRIIEWWWPYRH